MNRKHKFQTLIFRLRVRFQILFWMAVFILILIPFLSVTAHDGEPHSSDGVWTDWHFDPLIVLLLIAVTILYLRGWNIIAHRAKPVRPDHRNRLIAFTGSMAALAVALLSPVEGLAGDLFWVHMLQHNLLMLVAAPLLVISYPLPPLVVGLPVITQRFLGKQWASSRWLRAGWRGINQPWLVWLLYAATLWLWHIPGLYQASIENNIVHIFQHVSFLGSSLLYWWITIHTFGAHQEKRALGIFYLFTTALHSGLLGALITFSPSVWYPIYSGRTDQWGLTALQDQQLAGVVMWVPNGIIYLLAALILMKIWLNAYESKH